MQRKRNQSKKVKFNIAELEKEAAVICQDFAVFCDYVLGKEVKLAKNTGNIGKKDCFVLNSLFHVKEEYDKPTRLQSQYPVIKFFYYIAVKYHILQINSAGTALQKGKNYSIFQEASTWERYILFLAIFLSDGMFTVQDGYWADNRAAEMWQWYVDGFMEWVDEEKPCCGSRCRLSKTSRISYFYDLAVMIPYLEEFNLIKVWNRPDIEKGSGEYWWEIEVLPLLEAVSDLYENTDIDEEKVESKDTLIQYSYEAFMDRLIPGQKEKGLARIFEDAGAKHPEQTIALEVTVRYTACVRVIRMNLSDTLYELHRMIQKAVAFDNDHCYEFSVGRGMMKQVYVLPETMTSGDELSVYDTTLGELELRKGEKFTYLFDYGDMWWFDIRVLDIQDGIIDEPEVIKAVNDAPEQYPVYEEDLDGWRAEVTDQVSVGSILASIEDEFIGMGYAALMGLKKEQREKAPEEMRREMERILLGNPDRMLTFMTVEMRNMLSELLQEEWIDESGKCTIAKLYSFGFCTFSEEDEYVISVPKTVQEVYATKLKGAGKKDQIAETAEFFLRRCGVMETERLYSAVVKFMKSRISYDDFEFLVYSRLHYFGAYDCDSYDGKEYISCYDREMTEKILSERLKPENAAYDYPDFEKLYSERIKKLPEAQVKWKEYIDFNLSIDWRVARELITAIPAMAASGVVERDEIVAVYKESIRSAGGRMTKKAETLINKLCASMPLATRKGNTDVEEPSPDTQATKKQGKGKKSAEEGEYRQLSLFDS